MGKEVGGTTSWWSNFGTAKSYEDVYLRAFESVTEARRAIGNYLDFYNGRHPHSSPTECQCKNLIK